ncbi:Copper transporter [Musa troglodytarum]|uniref:Copper transporter n=1 Tax=Musa troglodytarum TaxID=320322 RepID=A0A9E7F7W3_9LILI|nr:Copper transporter [Musa troglodytarum]
MTLARTQKSTSRAGRHQGCAYALALVVVFAFSLLLEWLHHCRLVRPGVVRIGEGLAQTTLCVGLAFLVMLAVMSFNGGMLSVAVAGHTLAFLLFHIAACQKTPLQSAGGGKGSLPSMAC